MKTKLLYISDSETNLALGKPAFQSSTYHPSQVAIRAVNGNLMSCSHTQADQPAWLVVDLEEEYLVNRVVITNRFDCCGEY